VNVAITSVPPAAEVVAVIDQLGPQPASRGTPVVSFPTLLWLEDEGRQLRCNTIGTDPGISIALPGRAVHVVADASTRTAVCITDGAELVVVSLVWRCVFARIRGEGRVA
jgi:hypothetical protein